MQYYVNHQDRTVTVTFNEQQIKELHYLMEREKSRQEAEESLWVWTVYNLITTVALGAAYLFSLRKKTPKERVRIALTGY